MITTRKELRAYLRQDSLNYAGQNSGFVTRLKNNMLADTISDQKYIWKYIIIVIMDLQKPKKYKT